MSTETKTVKPWPDVRDGRDNAFALAVAVLRERVSRLSKEDQDDLYELLPALLSGDEEGAASAALAVNEILDQTTGGLSRQKLPEGPGDELRGWIDFVSRRIREEREKAGLTQVELAEKAGLPQSHVSRLENGQHSPTSVTLERIAKALDVPASVFDPSA